MQKKLMADLRSRGMPFSSRKEKVTYCEEFYRSLGVEHGRNIGRIPIHISSAVRHFFHNNLQVNIDSRSSQWVGHLTDCSHGSFSPSKGRL